MATKAWALILAALSSLLLASASSNSPTVAADSPPSPTPWPHQFHAVTLRNYSGSLALIDIWYDWPNGRNFNIIQNQLGGVIYDLEWNNGTSFYYSLNGECKTVHFEVGILRPNWLDGAQYLGQERVDGFLCNVWQKVDFIRYYEDVAARIPVKWIFYTGRTVHVMTFEVGATLEDAKWQTPVYCFEKAEDKRGAPKQWSSAQGMPLAKPDRKRLPSFWM